MQIKHILMALFTVLVIQGCAYTDIRTPLDTNLEQTELGTKHGTSSMHSLLWLVAWGDASYAKAAENGKIVTMRHADQQLEQYVFRLYVKRTTIVYGD